MIWIAAEVVVLPPLSVAFAVMVCVPAVAPVHGTVYGAVVARPIDTVPSKYSTWFTVPSESLAFAVNVMVAGVLKLAPLAGDAMETVGAWLGAAAAANAANASSSARILLMASCSPGRSPGAAAAGS
jgi:hypothetical protein